ncbi:hypothetical protein A6A03_07565 [Chloroflexus islandicus]|uniref:Uncharacterized protein n=1 Tax=Chloroflexus islandicus TaxID=1707952 RepID=A0A178MJ90_9CHLR|nr:hypothetical protein A6A03_07565 [Chloroflexus islandicus]
MTTAHPLPAEMYPSLPRRGRAGVGAYVGAQGMQRVKDEQKILQFPAPLRLFAPSASLRVGLSPSPAG